MFDSLWQVTSSPLSRVRMEAPVEEARTTAEQCC